jgi:hypothetical protein
LFQERAESYYRYAAHLDARSVLAQRKLGLFLARRGEQEEAELYLLKTLELGCQQEQPVDATTLLALVGVLEKKEDFETASAFVDFFKHVHGLHDEWLNRRRGPPPSPSIQPRGDPATGTAEQEQRGRTGSMFRKTRGTIRVNSVASESKGLALFAAGDAVVGSPSTERDSNSNSASPRKSPTPLKEAVDAAVLEKLPPPISKSPRTSSKFFSKSLGKLK